jgi:hypothetical protein
MRFDYDSVNQSWYTHSCDIVRHNEKWKCWLFFVKRSGAPLIMPNGNQIAIVIYASAGSNLNQAITLCQNKAFLNTRSQFLFQHSLNLWTVVRSLAISILLFCRIRHMPIAIPETTDYTYCYYYGPQNIAMTIYSNLYDIVIVGLPPMSHITNGLSLIIFWRMRSSKQQVGSFHIDYMATRLRMPMR